MGDVLGDRFAGVGILVNTTLMPFIKKYHEVSGRLCAIDMLIGKTRYRIISVYLPTTDYDIDILEDLYGQLGELVGDARRNGMKLIIGGDFNTEYDVGPRGDLLRDFLDEYALDAMNKPGIGLNDETWTHRGAQGYCH